MTAVSCRQSMPGLIRNVEEGQVKDLIIKLRNEKPRKNRTVIDDQCGIYSIGALMQNGLHLRPELHDDVVLALGVESVEEVQIFTRIQLKERIIHSQMYKRVTKRNSFTVAYKGELGEIEYGQIEVFVKTLGRSPVKYGAVLLSLEVNSAIVICNHNLETNVTPVNHIAICHPPQTNQCTVINLFHILDVCVCMHFSDNVFVAQAPNHFEKD